MIITTRPYTKFYKTTEASWEAMLEACRNAKKTIDLEEFIFVHDGIGKQFIEVFIKKADEGVKVRLLLDMVGSFSFYLSGIDHYLKSRGIEVVYFNPISFWRIGNITSHFFRDHRKILIVDGEISLIGGVGIEDRMKSWRDTMVEVRGELTENTLHIFDLMWKRVTRGKYRRFKRPPHYHKDYEIVINSPRFRQRFLYHAFISHIQNAEERIYLATPYFIPNHKFLRALRVAAHRGVDVRVIIPKISNPYIIDFIQSWYITQCLKTGIRVFTYNADFYHVKMALIDNDWATVGSFNFDNLSFSFNHEANIISSDKDFASEINEHFKKDFLMSKEILYSHWVRRSRIHKILEVLTWPFHKLF